MSEKTPTTLLLDKNKKFVSFGYAAENDYSSMTEEKRKEHYYFRRFKMTLYDKDGKLKLSRNTILKDLRDKEMPAIEGFARSIEYLKDEFVKKFGERNLKLSILPLNENVTWEVRDDGKIQEVNRAQDGDWSGIYVDEEFKRMLEDIVSKPIIEAFCMKYTGDYIALFRFFEKKKRQTQAGKIVRVHVPPTLLEIADNIVKCIADHGLNDEIELKRDKLQIKVRKFEEFFNKVLDEIVVKVEEMLVSDTVEGTKVIIMVGGFSEFKYTYGVDTYTRFIKDKHPESRKKLINGIEYCADKFDIVVNKGKLVHCNEEINKTYSPIYEDQTSVKFGVFASNAIEPQYNDDEGCKEMFLCRTQLGAPEGKLRQSLSSEQPRSLLKAWTKRPMSLWT
uniref:Uncharacterized protein n=1 Tax=Magallana gigas TaxID=29159 RepID=A0A8W8ITK4_MAGGI